MSPERVIGSAALAIALSIALCPPANAACARSQAGRPGAHGASARVPLGPADIGVLPEACEATEASLEGRAAALVATEDLYGSLVGGVGLRGRLVIAERTWLSLWTPSLEHRFVANATVEANRTSLGGSALGLHHRVALRRDLSLSPFARLLLPTETGFERATRLGAEHGVSGIWELREKLELTFGFAFSLISTYGGTTLSRLGETVSANFVYRPSRVFAIAAGAALRTDLALADVVESFDPTIALRLYPYRGLFFVLGAATPLWGRDRTDLGLALSGGWSF